MPRIKPLLLDIGQGFSLMLGLPTISSWKTNNRPKKPKTGTIGFNEQTHNLEYWDGKYWYTASMA